MSWLIIAIFSWFLLAVAALIDKYLLGGRLINPPVYAFYGGILNILVFVFAPFGFFVPEIPIIIIALLAGIFHIVSIFVAFKAIQEFEVSRVIPAIGGLLPLFVFVFTLVSAAGKIIPSLTEMISFLFLILGSVIITREREKALSLRGLRMTILASFLMALYFILVKFVYLSQPFINGLIWTRIGAFLTGITFLFIKEVREEIFRKRSVFNPRILKFLIPNQLISVSAFLLQSWAIVLVPFGYLAFINALEGTRYVFLLIFTVVISLKFPRFLKEEISKETIFQKIVAVLFIVAGLVLLAFK